jgi:hypothetical protein
MRIATVCWLIALGTAFGLSSCMVPPGPEHMCSEGFYPTWRPAGTGGDCVRNGRAPQVGYVAYPASDVPDLEQDRYAPLRRYPELEPWAEEYRRWVREGHHGPPPPMPSVSR